MDRMDPINTTALDGCACQVCGDDPATVERCNERPMWLCDHCYEEQIGYCADCDERYLLADMERTFGSPNLYCPSCAKRYQPIAAGLEAASQADVARDDR
jgi:hypothetical protein